MTYIKQLDDLQSVARYLKRIGAEPRSLKTAVVKEISGSYWRDLAVIYFGKDGEIKASSQYAPTDLEAAAIKAEFSSSQFPELKKSKRPDNLPFEIKNANPDDVFEFRDETGSIIMIQLRREKDGEKSYIPYTYWSDDVWRCAEPDGQLPLWGIEQLNHHTTVFIHEGAKAARSVKRMVEAQTKDQRDKLQQHPWGEELSNAAHIGWIGGALSPHRTDWSILQRLGVKRAYIVSDNDQPGVAAVPAISYQLRVPTFHLQFTNEWPVSFDLADDFPKHMWETFDGVTHYAGPSFRSCLHPATWATDQIQNKNGKPTNVLRENFKDMWAYVEEADLFVCIEMPEIVRQEMVMNKMLSAFSHSANTSQLMVKSYRGRSTKLCYRPDEPGKIVTDKTTSAINLHTPPHIKPREGNIQPFLEYMEYMFPKKDEHHEMLRWCATIIARPDIRMEYGVLLVSETQGIGKTTLGSSILSPLVGPQNVSYPTEMSIVQSEFNDWVANRRLVIVNEIYSGHSWKAYNKLKSVITDFQVEVNQKYQRRYTVDNWCHIFACSNSMRALRMEEDDRRWFYPEVSEQRWPREKFNALHNWLKAGGLSFIMHWAKGFGDYVLAGQRSPMTARKRDLIDGSRTEAQREVTDLASAMNETPTPIAMTMREIVEWVKSSATSQVYDTDYELRKAMKEAGCILFPKRLKIAGRMQYIVANRNEYWEALLAKNEEDIRFGEEAKRFMRSPGDILSQAM